MGKGVVTVRRVRSEGDLQSQIEDFLRDFSGDRRRITAAVEIAAGHEYWWFLEYGTSPAEGSPGPKAGDFIKLTKPAGLRASSHNHSIPYLIVPKPKYFYTAEGKRKRRKLRFRDRSGKVVYRLAARHPGIPAMGIIRMTLWTAQRELLARLTDLFDDDTLPDRDEVVDVVNDVYGAAVDSIRSSIPVGRNDDFDDDTDDEQFDGLGHLRDAIRLKPAK
jgi:hypothetical protein